MNNWLDKLYIKTDSMCVGDLQHNEYMDILVKDIQENDSNKIIIEYFSKPNWKTGNWVFDLYSKEELRSLNVIMRTKNKKTLTTRIIRFISKLNDKHPYTLMLEKNKIIGLTDMLGAFSIKYMEVNND